MTVVDGTVAGAVGADPGHIGTVAVTAPERAVALTDNDAAVDWLRGQLVAGEVVLIKASCGARLDEVAAALPYGAQNNPARAG